MGENVCWHVEVRRYDRAMAGYEPVTIEAVCNAGVDALEDAAGDLPLGRVELRGLPFLVGSDAPSKERCFVVPTAPVSIEVGRTARRVIIAHRLLKHGGPAGHGVGTPVADYVFHLAGGEAVTVPIRERFEIQVVPTAWGQQPVPRRGGQPRQQGRPVRGRLGRCRLPARRARVAVGPGASICGAGRIPQPDVVVERIELIPRDLPFLVAGITLGQAEEHPFVRTPSASGAAGRHRPRPGRPRRRARRRRRPRRGHLPPTPTESTTTAPARAPATHRPPASPAYAHIAAIPSATVTVRQRDAELGQISWADVERDGQAATDRVRVELVDPGRNWVHVTVLDDDTGQPVPCRVHFRSPEGVPYQPHGHHHHVNPNLGSWHFDVGGDVRLGQTAYAYIDGTCQGWLPRGEVIVDVARGFEYAPLRETVESSPASATSPCASSAPPTWLPAAGSGRHPRPLPLHRRCAARELGEDLRVVNLLQSQWGALFTNTEDCPVVPDGGSRGSVIDGGGYFTYVGQENRQHVLGHLVLRGLKEPVMPWCSDGPGEAELGGTLETTLSDWADRPTRRAAPSSSRTSPTPTASRPR